MVSDLEPGAAQAHRRGFLEGKSQGVGRNSEPAWAHCDGNVLVAAEIELGAILVVDIGHRDPEDPRKRRRSCFRPRHLVPKREPGLRGRPGRVVRPAAGSLPTACRHDRFRGRRSPSGLLRGP